MIKRRALRTRDILMLVLDEADEMLNKGFKEQIYDVYRYLPPETQVSCWSFKDQFTSLPTDCRPDIPWRLEIACLCFSLEAIDWRITGEPYTPAALQA